MYNNNKTNNLSIIKKKYEETKPAIIMALIIITGGLYIINWIYLRNKEFELMDDLSPDANRGLALMVFLPFGWGLIIWVFKSIIFSESHLILNVLEIVNWGLILFLLLNYFFDFCESFGKITKSSPMLWFFLFLLGFVGGISTAIEYYYLTPLIFFTIIAIPSMHAELATLSKTKKKGRRESSIMSFH